MEHKGGYGRIRKDKGRIGAIIEAQYGHEVSFLCSLPSREIRKRENEKNEKNGELGNWGK